MTRKQMVNTIRDRLLSEHELEASKELIELILKIEEDEIYQVIALNDSYKYVYGTIGGKEVPPKRITGMYTELAAVKKNFGYSQWKKGYPYFKWSKEAKYCDIHPAKEYFDMPEHRYTTDARDYRIAAGLPEIPEYASLDEEQIKNLCEQADQLKYIDESKTEAVERKRIERKNKRKYESNLAYLESRGIKPMGVKNKDYKGEVGDTITYFLETKITDETPANWALEYVRRAKDMADYKDLAEKHGKMLDELEEKYLKLTKEQGLEELGHFPFRERVKMSDQKYQKDPEAWRYFNMPIEQIESLGELAMSNERFQEILTDLLGQEEMLRIKQEKREEYNRSFEERNELFEKYLKKEKEAEKEEKKKFYKDYEDSIQKIRDSIKPRGNRK